MRWGTFAKTQAREFLSKLGDLHQTQIFAKIENIEVPNKETGLPFIYQSILSVHLIYIFKLWFFLVLLAQGLTHFDEILQEADGIILSRGNLGIDLPPEKVINSFGTLFFEI